MVSRDDRIDINKAWKNIKATVCGDHEIPDLVAAPVRVRVQHAPVGSHVCLKGSKYIKRLANEPIISSVQEGHVTVPLVVNTMGSPIKNQT